MRKATPPTTKGNLARQDYGAQVSNRPIDAALDYAAQGHSVIALRGNERGKDYQDGKRPAYPWTANQIHAADAAQLTEWFNGQGLTALGIVLGSVSQAAALEFDDLARQAAFEQQHERLTRTRTHISGKRRGKHFIYRLPPELFTVKSHNVASVGEFKANGQYVVAPPTTIKGYSWEVENDAEPLTLTKGDYEAILEFLGVGASSNQLLDAQSDTSADGLVFTYHDHRTKHPRNYSAYLTMQQAANAGWLLEDAIAAIASDYVTDPAPDGHERQTDEQRAQELQRTAASAYKRKLVAPGTYQADGRGLPNSIREYLMQQPKVTGQPLPANHARVLDMLYLTGLQPGQRFTERAAIECGKLCSIGNKTVIAALDWLEQKQAEITVLRTGAGVAVAPSALTSQNSFVSELPIYSCRADITMLCIWQIGHKTPTGRPTKVYTLPEISDLCTVLGVTISPGDKLELSDLKSTKAYRVGLQRALVARSADKAIGRQWQANRLGVSIRTVYSYDVPATSITSVLGASPQNITEFIGAALIKVQCVNCGNSFDMILKSRTALKATRDARHTCTECDDMARRTREEETQAYREQIKAEREYLRTMPYAEYLKTDHWQELRTRMLKRAGYSCQVCNSKNVSLHVHHRTYANRGNEDYSDLIVLCANCHGKFHDKLAVQE